jgi:hypothetical protein
VPTSSSSKQAIIQWLQSKNIPFDEDMRKPELYQLLVLKLPENMGMKYTSLPHIIVGEFICKLL